MRDLLDDAGNPRYHLNRSRGGLENDIIRWKYDKIMLETCQLGRWWWIIMILADKFNRNIAFVGDKWPWAREQFDWKTCCYLKSWTWSVLASALTRDSRLRLYRNQGSLIESLYFGPSNSHLGPPLRAGIFAYAIGWRTGHFGDSVEERNSLVNVIYVRRINESLGRWRGEGCATLSKQRNHFPTPRYPKMPSA